MNRIDYISIRRPLVLLLLGIIAPSMAAANLYRADIGQFQLYIDPTYRTLGTRESLDLNQAIELTTITHTNTLESTRNTDRRGQIWTYADGTGRVRALVDTEGFLLPDLERQGYPTLLRYESDISWFNHYIKRSSAPVTANILDSSVTLYSPSPLAPPEQSKHGDLDMRSEERIHPVAEYEITILVKHYAARDDANDTWVDIPNRVWHRDYNMLLRAEGYTNVNFDFTIQQTGQERILYEPGGEGFPSQRKLTQLARSVPLVSVDTIPTQDIFGVFYQIHALAGADPDHFAAAYIADPLNVDGDNSGISLANPHEPAPDDLRLRDCDDVFDGARYAIDGPLAVDRYTGLEWQRCPAGYAFDDGADSNSIEDDRCDNRATPESWRETLVATPTDWRLPNVKELESLVATCSNATIEPKVFPDTPTTTFWSSSPAASATTASAWQVNFGDGGVRTASIDAPAFARYVRASGSGPVLPAPQVSMAGAMLPEGDTATVSHRVPITLSRELLQDVNLSYAYLPRAASAPEDFLVRQGTVTIAAGETKAFLNVEVVGDTTPEGNESFYITLSDAPDFVRLQRALVAIVIEDDEAIARFGSTVPSASEASRSVRVPVLLSKPLAADSATVDYRLRSGSATAVDDYMDQSGVLSFSQDDDIAFIEVGLVEDGVLEGDETFEIVLSNPQGLTLESGLRATELSQTVRIYDPLMVGPRSLNDTGTTECLDVDGAEVACPAALAPQDADLGRDATPATAGNGDGELGFSFTRLDAAGMDHSGSTSFFLNPWSCVQDNTTGLIWEVKSLFINDPIEDNDFRSARWTYSWFNSSGIGDGGSIGMENGGSCRDVSDQEDQNCDTEKYIAAVNAANLCGFNDWRLPTRQELFDIVNTANPGGMRHDEQFFPNLPLDTDTLGHTWTATPSASAEDAAWVLNEIGLNTAPKDQPAPVRLVRGNPQPETAP